MKSYAPALMFVAGVIAGLVIGLYDDTHRQHVTVKEIKECEMVKIEVPKGYAFHAKLTPPAVAEAMVWAGR